MEALVINITLWWVQINPTKNEICSISKILEWSGSMPGQPLKIKRKYYISYLPPKINQNVLQVFWRPGKSIFHTYTIVLTLIPRNMKAASFACILEQQNALQPVQVMVQVVLPLRPRTQPTLWVYRDMWGRGKILWCLWQSLMRITMKNPNILKKTHITSNGQSGTFQNYIALGVLLLGLGRNGMSEEAASNNHAWGPPTRSWTLSSLKASCSSGVVIHPTYLPLESFHLEKEAHQNPEGAVPRTFTRRKDSSGTRRGLW